MRALVSHALRDGPAHRDTDTAMASSPTSRDRDMAAAVVVEEEVGDAQPRQEWIMLAAVPDVRRSSRMFPPGTDFVLALKKPPHVSHVTVAARIAPGLPATPTRFPYVVAIDAGGAFLLCVTQRAREPPLATGADASVGRARRRREFARVPAYFLCDAHTGVASRVPDPPVGGPLSDFHRVGLISRPCGGGGGGGGGVAYAIAELVPMLGTDHATLRLYWSATGLWLSKEVKYAGLGHPESWANDVVISHAQKLWWVDLSCGLLACDPFTEHQDLLFVPLPDGCVPPVAGTENDLIKHRCVTSSGGKLRYIQIHSRLGVPIISVWVLADPEHATWDCECHLPFSEIWSRRWVSRITRKKSLMVAAAHPVHTGMLFFVHGPRQEPIHSGCESKKDD